MLKNKIWIVALFVALTIGFIGCTDAAFDWVPPVEELNDNALQIFPKQTWAGIELNHAKFNFAAGDVIVVTGKALAANTIHISNNHQGWNPIGATGEQRVAPDEEFELKATLTKADVTSIAGLSPAAIRIYGRTANATFIIYNITVTRGGEEFFNFYEIILKDLKPGTTGAVAIFGEKGANTDPLLYRSEAWVGVADGESNSHSEAVFTILGPGYGGSAAVEVPTYKGDPTKVEFIKGTGATPAAAALNDKVIDHDPSITGDNVTINADGTAVGITTGSVVHYKFPAGFITGTGKKATTNPLDLENDYDSVEIDYTISGVVTTSGGSGNFKARLFQYESTTNYGNSGTGSIDYDGSGYADFGAAGTGKVGTIQTWGAGGKGGFTIGFNQYDIASSGCDSLNLKINKVTFTKTSRFKVSFFSPQTFATIADVTVRSGNGLGTKLPAPTNAPWVFGGWYDAWDKVGQQGTGTNKYTATTPVTADTKLYAKWLIEGLPDATVSGASLVITANANAREFTVSGVKWYAMGHTNFNDEDDTDEWIITTPAIDASSNPPISGALIYITIPATVGTENVAHTLYDTVVINYDYVAFTGDNGAGKGAIIRNGNNGGAPSLKNLDDNEYPDFDVGTNQTMSYKAKDFDNAGRYIGIAFNQYGTVGAGVIKINSVTFKMD